MHREATQDGDNRPGASRRPGRRAAMVLALVPVMVLLAGTFPTPSRAADPELATFELTVGDDGVFLSYGVNLELSRSVDDALSKAVPLFFVAEAELFRNRFYWRDQRIGYAARRWRIVFQPLTSTYRVTFDGGLSQNYTTRADAFAAISRAARWKIAEGPQIEEGSRHYVEFSFRLDTSQLPRPMQIGIGGQADWAMSVQRTQKIN
ncbi:MAG: DUF4390 domain-containing protein [Rhizobiales bacterium]|nr:DUF4390 domain-containing protein [Rhizobacter sp.]